MKIRRIFVQLDVEGDEEDVHDVIDALLDGGEFQDAINDFSVEGKPDGVHVKSAVVRWHVNPDSKPGED